MISRGTQCVRIDPSGECTKVLAYNPFDDKLYLYEEHEVTPTMSMWVPKHPDYATAVSLGLNHCATAILRAELSHKVAGTYHRVYGSVYFSGSGSALSRDISPDDSARLHVFARLSVTEHERLIKEEV